jgi:thioredoxin-dependent peroxiredoxin
MGSINSSSSNAHNFQANDVFGNKIKLVNRDEGYTLLVFLRYSGCPWCNLAIHRLSLEHAQLQELNCKIIAFVQSDTTSIKENIYDRHTPQPPFPIIADATMKYYKMYGVSTSFHGTFASITKIPYWLISVQKLGFKQRKMDGSMFLVPAWFLINHRKGKIVRSQRGVSFYNHETFTDIYNSLVFQD